tara:strand:- start:216 stop:614 length:399 start_codon:yes stop_codon:yes gene_type:complete
MKYLDFNKKNNMKLKTLLEGYAWERKSNGSLPTLSDATAKHESNLKEQGNSEFDPGGHYYVPQDASHTKLDANPTGEQLAEDLYDAINNINDSMSYKDLAFAVARVLEDSYGTHNYDRFISELKTNLDKMRY